VTDEDAFREIDAYGTGILVAQKNQLTQADYRLNNPGEVEQFLVQLHEKLAGFQS
jgi:hypothetical protein